MRLAVIPARGGSKRIPMKNVASFHGKPIIGWSIRAALDSGCFDHVVVSTDSEQIAEIAVRHGATVPFMRPPPLADDHTGTVPVIKHAVEWFSHCGEQPTEVCCIYATAPMIEPRELQEGLHLLQATGADYVFTATAFSYPIQRALRLDRNLRVSMFYPQFAHVRSQDLETAWHDAAQFYWGTADAWVEEKPVFESNSRVIAIPRSRVHDVDTQEDLDRLEMLFAAAVMQRRRAELSAQDRSLEQAGLTERFSLGTVQFGMDYGIANEHGKVRSEHVPGILRRAERAGIRSLDTAAAYGESEAVLGRADVRKWEVTTKLSPVPEDVANVYEWAREQVLGSLDRLQLTRVHGLMLHRPDQVLGIRGGELVDALYRLKEDGLVGKVGVSVYSPSDLERLLMKMRFELVQVPCNILDRRLVDSGWASRLKEAGIELHTRSVFLQGLLLLPEKDRPAKFARWKAIWSRWSSWVEQHDLNPVQACLLYALSIPEVDKIVVGVDGIAHLEAMIATRIRELPPLPEWSDDLSENLLDPTQWRKL